VFLNAACRLAAMSVPYRKVFEELEARQIQYLIVGGFAVNLHKVQRLIFLSKI